MQLIVFNGCCGASHHGKLLIATFGTHLPPWQHMYLGSTCIEESMLTAVHSERSMVSIVEGCALRLATSGLSLFEGDHLAYMCNFADRLARNKPLSMLCFSSSLYDLHGYVLCTMR